jgi:lipopolysaccharide/colanic/teichoic acid biosynthesis glycosyltransferase
MAMHRTQRPRSMTTLFVRPLPLWKRSIDVVVSGAALIVLSPLLLAVAAAIKLTSSGPIIFRQQRDTLGGRGFMIYKFRTMCVDAEARKAALRQLSEQDGPAFKIAKDPRVTRIGRILRSTSIDELPQLLNVFLGDMTLVGPRALPTRESNGCEPWQRRRLDVTAGITCIWQVRGRSAVTFAEWMRMDLQYIRTRSAANDLKLLAQTVPAVVIGRGAC